jgi:isopentenyl-diphosphate delta-isomerase
MRESDSQFEGRKRDHIALALKVENQTTGLSGLDRVELLHEALPDLDFSELTLAESSLGSASATPFLVSSMTAGHHGSVDLNARLAKACAERGWWMGVGSQRRELFDREAHQEWQKVRSLAPDVVLLGNIGIAQLIRTEISQIESLVEALHAKAMIIHLNALQECMQPEGTPQFRGGLTKITQLAQRLSVPVVVKETGCGFSAATLRRLFETQVGAVDVSGLGGTHWGRVEGGRSPEGSVRYEASLTFENWGIGTLESLLAAVQLEEVTKRSPKSFVPEIWASGGVRNGLDAAKLIAAGAKKVGFAKTILEAAVISEEALHHRMEVIEYEFKTALFCTGSRSCQDLRAKGVRARQG